MMQKIFLSNDLGMLTGLAGSTFSPGDGSFSQDGKSHATDEQLHLFVDEVCNAIATGKVTAAGYIAALLTHARRHPGLARIVMQIEAAALAAAEEIDKSLGVERRPPSSAKARLPAKKSTTSGEIAPGGYIESAPPPLKY